ncbi:MAG: hypothetical protein Q7J34_07335 [Bacteroidales bacterium]|nr:hypothetical protein [Bacteroidales bacterium]
MSNIEYIKSGMKIFRKKLNQILVVFIVFSGFLTSAQINSPGDTITIEKISEEVGEFLDIQLKNLSPPINFSDTAFLHLLFSEKYGELNQNDAYANWYYQKIKALKGDVGLRFTGNYTENLEPGFTSDEDMLYLRRISFGLDWDFLNSGWFANRSKVKTLEIEYEINSLESLKADKEHNYLYLYSYLTYVFKKQKTELLTRRQTVLDEQVRIARKMYYLRLASWERILEIQSKALEVGALRNNNEVYYNRRLQEGMEKVFLDESMLSSFLPVIDIEPEKMIALFNRSPLESKIKDLKLKRYDANNFRLNDFSLKPFVKYNMITDDKAVARNYASAGVSVGIPLKWPGSVRKEIDAQKQIIDNEEEINMFAKGNELLNHYYEYQYKKMQYISFHFKKLLIEERLRKELVMKELNDEGFSPLRALQILDEKVSVEIEMVDLKKDMYLKMLKIYNYLDVTNPNNFVKVIKPEELGRRYAGYRFTYIWSETFKSTTNGHLLALLKNNEFREVFVSAGSTPDIEKLQDFVQTCRLENIKVHLMIGENSLVKGGNAGNITARLAEYSDIPFNGIHLDIEPHAFDDFRSNEGSYMNALISVLNATELYCRSKGMEVSISIPLHYKDEYLAQIYAKSDKVFLMAYETTDIEKISRRSSEEIVHSLTKTVYAVSASDFPDRLAMEYYIQQLLLSTQTSSVAVHDLRRMVELDEKTIKKSY